MTGAMDRDSGAEVTEEVMVVMEDMEDMEGDTEVDTEVDTEADSGEETSGATTTAVATTWAGEVRARWEDGADMEEEVEDSPGATEAAEEVEGEEEEEGK